MIIMGPPGLGKSTLACKYTNKIIDLDSGFYLPFSEHLNDYINDIVLLDQENKIILTSSFIKVFDELLVRGKRPLVFYYDTSIQNTILDKILNRDGRKSTAYNTVDHQTEQRFNKYVKYDNAICIGDPDYDLEYILKQRGIL